MELVEDNNDVEELLSLALEKILLKWMNFHLIKAGYKKHVTKFSSDVKVFGTSIIIYNNKVKMAALDKVYKINLEWCFPII